MNRVDLLKELNEIFCKEFEQEDLILDEKMGIGDIEGWDSIEHINLILQLQAHFQVKFDIKNIIAMNTVKAILDAIITIKSSSNTI